jgi:hypothetical protein
MAKSQYKNKTLTQKRYKKKLILLICGSCLETTVKFKTMCPLNKEQINYWEYLVPQFQISHLAFCPSETWSQLRG